MLPHLEKEAHPIDLATALRLTQAQSPWIAAARERLREALALQDRADLQWVPDFFFNPNWMRHDGQIQRFNGEVPTISRSSLAVTGGPGLSLHMADALYAPLVARQITNANAAGAAAETNEQLLDVSLAYQDLLQTTAEIAIAEETLRNAQEMLEQLISFEKAGKTAPADTARARTEANQRETELVQANARVKVVSARLAELLSLPADLVFRPAERDVVPVPLVPQDLALQELIAQSIQYRPELAENRAYVEAALQRWRATRTTPMLPHLVVEYSGGGFGGGPNGYFSDFDTRGDFTAMAVWRLKGLGLANLADQRASASRYGQANYRLAQVENAIANQVVSNYHLAAARQKELAPAKNAVDSAQESYKLNRDRIKRAPDESRPIELLQAIQALNRTRLDYLKVITDYNRTQFRLYTALGYAPHCALQSPPAGVDEPAPAPRRLP